MKSFRVIVDGDIAPMHCCPIPSPFPRSEREWTQLFLTEVLGGYFVGVLDRPLEVVSHGHPKNILKLLRTLR